MKIIECPRDAMQGLAEFIPTQSKIDYINQLLKVGFDTIDFGSFVSHKAVPQMRDTVEVVRNLDWYDSRSKLLAIVANKRGADEAAAFKAITYLGFPLSVSETFQRKNTNKSIAEALNELEEIQNVCQKHGKKLVVYISMGFGNPYGDPYSIDLIGSFVDIIITLGANVISLADTIGAAEPDAISKMFTQVTRQYPHFEIGVHLHSLPQTALKKIEAAYKAGCRRLDGALKGYGGCPMADNDLVGNLATETILSYMKHQKEVFSIDEAEFGKALLLADKIFPKH